MIGHEVIQSNLRVHDIDLRKAVEHPRNMPHKRGTGPTANEMCNVASMSYEPPNAIMITQSCTFTLFFKIKTYQNIRAL